MTKGTRRYPTLPEEHDLVYLRPLMPSPTWVSTDDGCKLAAFDFGGDGEPLMFVHATGFHAHLWLPVIELLSDCFHCYAFDQRGHGASPTPPDGNFAWGRMGEDARQVAGELGLSRPKVVGHSGGGAQLLLAEEDHPGSWEALWAFEPVVLDAPLPPTESGDNPMAAGAMKRRDRFDSRDAAYANFVSKDPFAAFTPEALRLYVEYGFVEDPEGGVRLACRREDEAAMYRNAPSAGTFERLDLVRIPTHWACGATSTHLPAERLRAAAARLRAGEVEELEGVGHFAPFENPGLVAASIRRTLA